MNIELYNRRVEELYSLVDDKSEIRSIGSKGIKILVDKGAALIKNASIKFSSTNYFGVYTTIYSNGKKKQTSVGRFLLGITDPKMFCDHINRNVLDNRMINLRSADRVENGLNKLCTVGVSGYKNVLFDAKESRYRIEVVREGTKKTITFSKFLSPFFAAIVADCINVRYDRQFCLTNFDKNMYTEEYIEFILSNCGISIPDSIV